MYCNNIILHYNARDTPWGWLELHNGLNFICKKNFISTGGMDLKISYSDDELSEST